VIELRILGLPMSCWKCGKETVAVVGAIPLDLDPLLFSRTSDDDVLALVARILPAGVPGVGVIKIRESKTAGHSYLSNGCVDCDALLGNFFVFHEELMEFLVVEGVGQLTEVARVAVSEDDWNGVRRH
jgi:hypothetical protein